MTTASPASHAPNRRILIIDDNLAIHKDFQKVLSGPTLAARAVAADLAEAEAALFNGTNESDVSVDPQRTFDAGFDLAFAAQGKEGVEMVSAALAAGTPFAMAFVDMRMPPGWDGLETIRRLWQVDPRLEVAICTAYSDYTWTEIVSELGPTDRLLILKKPFDSTEARQIALGTTCKWELARSSESSRAELESQVEARTTDLRAEIARRAALEADLRAARDAADAANRAKSEFLANMSHEIRTPLNGIIGMIDLLVGTEPDSGQRRYAEVAKGSARLLLSIINDILDFSKVEAGRLDMETIDFDLHSLIEEVMDSFAPAAEAKGLDLGCLIEPAVPRMAAGDPNRLRQVLSNLLANAIKFTTDGHVSARIALDSSHPGEHRIIASIADTGIGISPNNLDRLFKPFSQAEASTTRKYGGTGLGLAISRRIVQLMGGEISVQSTPGHGSTFRFSVNLRPCCSKIGASDSDELAANVARIGLSRVLLVGSAKSTMEVLSAQMCSCTSVNASTGAGLLEHAGDGATAMSMVRSAASEGRPFSLVLIDSRSPAADSLSRAIKADRSPARTRVISVRGIHEAAGNAAAPAGFDTVIRRPVKHSELQDAIIKLYRDPAESAAAPLVPAPRESAEPRIIRVLIADDNDVNQLVVQSLLNSRGYSCQPVMNGRDAVDAVMREPYDLLLMDWSMPVMDGVEATRQIRAFEGTAAAAGRRRVPIVALTAAALDEDREQCEAAGMDAYVSKPIMPGELFSVCERLLSDWKTLIPTPQRAVA